jgi:hypothetical protein
MFVAQIGFLSGVHDSFEVCPKFPIHTSSEHTSSGTHHNHMVTFQKKSVIEKEAMVIVLMELVIS